MAGVKEPSVANVIFTLLNIIIILFILIVGGLNAKISNWQQVIYVRL
jgi:hypothetical protein